jgi:hypothetical protein
VAPPPKARRFLLAGLVVSAVLVAPATARADIGITRVSPTSASPGQSVEVDIGCGWPRGCGPRLPVFLIAAGTAPEPRPCRMNSEKAVCTPIRRGPPRERPYLFLGSATKADGTTYGQLYQLRFQGPNLRPGLYAFVVYAAYRRPRGSGALISSTGPGTSLRVRREGNSTGSDANDSLTIWPIVAAGIAAILAAGIALRRRRS